MPGKDIFMVIGGNGFLGRNIVQQLLDRGDNVSVFDIVERYHDVPFYGGDMTNESEVAEALRKVNISFVSDFQGTDNIAERNNLYHSHCFPTCRRSQRRTLLQSQCWWYQGDH